MHFVFRRLLALDEQPALDASIHGNTKSETEKVKVRVQDSHAGMCSA